jgi:hypothetical protein
MSHVVVLKRGRVFATAATFLVALLVVRGAAGAETTVRADTVAFGGTTYVHRWSQGTQHEYTPQAQPSLDHWNDMITLNVYTNVTDGEALAKAANAVLDNYQGVGKILRVNSVPRTATSEAQHFIGAALGQPQFIEAVLTRILMVDGTGYAITYSHRIYGSAVSSEMSEWLKANGARSEAMLMALDPLPRPRALAALPQGK